MKVGFVSIVGRPNVGKSTLLNKILDYKISITSPKPQTTRDQIKGIYNDEESQIIFIDTPGIHKPQQVLSENLNEASYNSMKDADLILFLTPIDESIGPGDRMIIEKINKEKSIAVMTKLDKSNMDIANQKASALKDLGFLKVVGTSVLIDESINSFINFLKEEMPIGQPFYERDEITDKSMRFIAKEIIREATINRVNDEVPHSIGTMIEEFIEPNEKEKRYTIRAFIFVERESQKGIVVGKHGSKIKEIGIDARKQLSNILDKPVYLDLRVKVKKNWTDNENEIKKMGY